LHLPREFSHGLLLIVLFFFYACAAFIPDGEGVERASRASNKEHPLFSFCEIRTSAHSFLLNDLVFPAQAGEICQERRVNISRSLIFMSFPRALRTDRPRCSLSGTILPTPRVEPVEDKLLEVTLKDRVFRILDFPCWEWRSRLPSFFS